MQAKLTLEKGLKREFEVTVPSKNFDDEYNKQIEAVKKNVKIPGFRPGKVPTMLVKKKYGPSIVQDVTNKVVQLNTEKVLNDNNLKACMQPKVDAGEYAEGKDFKFKISFEILPNTPDIAFDKIALTKYVSEPEQKEIDAEIEKIVSQHKSFKESNRKACKDGDQVNIDYKGTVDGVAFDGGTAQGQLLELGSNMFIPGFEEQVTGMKLEETKVIKVTFPKPYGSKELEGKDAEFEVKLNSISEPTEAKLDDELAKKFGAADVVAFKDKIKKQITDEYNYYSNLALKKHLLDELEKQCEFEVPSNMLEMDIKSIKQQLDNENNHLDKKEQRAEKELQAEAEKLGLRRVRLGVLLADTGRKNNIKITEDEVRGKISQNAMQYPHQAQQIIEYYQKNPYAIEQIKGELLEEKVMDWILAKVKTTDKAVGFDELIAITEEEDSTEVKPAAKKKAPAKKADAKPTAKKSTETKAKTTKKASDKKTEKK